MATAPTTQLIHLRHDQLLPAVDNVRSHVGDVSELANSIASIGVLQPLRVSMAAGARKATIVAGERRHAAIGELIADGRWKKNQTIPCVFDGELDDESRVVAMLIENLQRADLDPIEEANGYQRLITDFGYSRERVRAATGRSKTAVQVRLALLKLAPEVQAAVAARTLPLDIASRLAALPKDVQEAIVARKGPSEITPWIIEEAEKDLARKEMNARFLRTCEERGLAPTAQPAWQLTKTHTATLTVPVKDFATVLLPADVTGGYARLDHYAKTVEIWLPAHTGPVSDDDELTVWRAECARIRAEHAKADSAWKARRLEQLSSFARTAPAKLVHEAALRFVTDEERTSDMLERAGFKAPDGFTDEDTLADLEDEWLKQPANLLALAAVVILEHSWFVSDLGVRFSQHVITEIGEPPAHPELPPHPTAGMAHTDAPAVEDTPGQDDVDLDDDPALDDEPAGDDPADLSVD